eukprot:COSAG05_NODE_1458_length_4828_cov_2.893001_1_plen_974_part_00
MRRRQQEEEERGEYLVKLRIKSALLEFWSQQEEEEGSQGEEDEEQQQEEDERGRMQQPVAVPKTKRVAAHETGLPSSEVKTPNGVRVGPDQSQWYDQVPRYMEQTRDQNAFIIDALSGERLDIMRQCVRVSIDNHHESDALEFMQQRFEYRMRSGTAADVLIGEWTSAHVVAEKQTGKIRTCWTDFVSSCCRHLHNVDEQIDDTEYLVELRMKTALEFWSQQYQPGADAHFRLGEEHWDGTVPGVGNAIRCPVKRSSCEGPVATHHLEILKFSRPDVPQRARMRSNHKKTFVIKGVVVEGLDTSALISSLDEIGPQNSYIVITDGLNDEVELKGDELEFLFQIEGPIRARVPRGLLSARSILLTGPAACGKSTLTKQYAHVIARDHISRTAALVVPYRVAIIDLAKTIDLHDLTATDDILGAHIDQDPDLAPLLKGARAEHRLVVILDGIDESGTLSSVLEPYIADKLSREVFLCLTGRENGISEGARNKFKRFEHLRVQPLTPVQQETIIRGRFDAKPVEDTSVDERVNAFMDQLQRCNFVGEDAEATMASSPLLLNLMLSEYLVREVDVLAITTQRRHARGDSAIQFDGRIVDGQSEYIGSFPGVEKKAWDSVTNVLVHRSVACVWLPDSSPLIGKHFPDPGSKDGKCFCQTFLYNDLPDHVRAKDPFKMIMHESDVHTSKEMPPCGKKVEVLFPGHGEYEDRWWICSVLEVDEVRQRLQVKMDGRGDLPSEWLSLQDPRLNHGGARRTDQQIGQAPFGCMWFSGWSENVHKAESLGQRAVVVFKKGQKGERSTSGLGNSQLKEFVYLEQQYPDKYGPARQSEGWKEIDATQFEQRNALNRAHIYTSATNAMITQAGKHAVGAAHAESDQIHAFLEQLAYASHTRNSEQFRRFSEKFAYEIARSSSLEGVWATMLESIRRSKFPLISWQPSCYDEDQFMMSHLSFQEYYAARQSTGTRPTRRAKKTTTGHQ